MGLQLGNELKNRNTPQIEGDHSQVELEWSSLDWDAFLFLTH